MPRAKKKVKPTNKTPRFKPRKPRRTTPRQDDIDWTLYPQEKVAYVKRRRANFLNEPTRAEKGLFKTLKREKVEYIPQYPISVKNTVFYTDIFIPSIGLIIELDGGCHDIPKVAKRDMRRTYDLLSLGYKVIRFPNETPHETILATIYALGYKNRD